MDAFVGDGGGEEEFSGSGEGYKGRWLGAFL